MQNAYGSEAFLQKKLELKILKHFHADLTLKLVVSYYGIRHSYNFLQTNQLDYQKS